MKRILSAILVLILSFGLATGCMPQGPISNDTSLKGFVAMGNASIFGDGTASILPEDDRLESLKDFPDEFTSDDGTITVKKDGSYNTKEEVAFYLHKYGQLPTNYYTKEEAKDEGWEGGSVEPYLGEGTAIGGNEFGNYEELLPGGESVQYYECDINTVGKEERGAERLVFSDKDNIYYTADHYESFEPVYVEE